MTISGAGDFSFGGEAVNPDITIRGLGDIYLKSYSGKLSTSGNVSIEVGEKPAS